jgi:hypothetical protein
MPAEVKETDRLLDVRLLLVGQEISLASAKSTFGTLISLDDKGFSADRASQKWSAPFLKRGNR